MWVYLTWHAVFAQSNCEYHQLRSAAVQHLHARLLPLERQHGRWRETPDAVLAGQGTSRLDHPRQTARAEGTELRSA